MSFLKNTVKDLERGLKHETASAKKEANKVGDKSVEGETKKVDEQVHREGETAKKTTDNHAGKKDKK